ncbi:putative ribonuclease H-like domain-containing protein [Tanacetum coccineum]
MSVLFPHSEFIRITLKGQIQGDPKSSVQTRGKIQKASSVQQALTISQALEDESWVEAMQEELLQFKLQKVWILVDLPFGKKAIGTKWVFRNKRDERSIVVKNKARLVAQGFRQEEDIDYDEVFAPVARIEAIRLFLAFASFMGFLVYQIDVKSAFLYETIGEEIYVYQPPGFVDLAHPNKVYKVIKALYGLHQAPRDWYETLSSFLLENGFRRGTIDKTLFIKKNKSDIMLVKVYVDDIIFGSTTQSMCTEFANCMHKRFQMSSMADILKKFDFCSIKTATTPIESNKPLVKDEDGIDVDMHVYRSMISSLMYLTASRPDIMFVVCTCARFQVTPKASHLNAVKMIFRYLKHQPKLGLWFPRDSPFELEAFPDSDYGGVSLGRRLISWQCKKQTIVANFTTEAEYITAANCCGQVLWIQNQMMDYGFNFMNTKIHIDNKSTICIVKNIVYHSRTKHIEIRHHFIRNCYEKRLIDVIKIHTDANVVDLLTKGFDVTRFNFLVLELILIRTSMNLRMDGSCAGSLSHIWYALSHNPTIYDSLVKQFWLTATVRTLANGIQELVASIDNKEYTITKAFTRSQLQLADATGEHVPLLPAMLAGAAPDQGEGSAIPAGSQPTPDLGPTVTPVADEATTTGVGVETGGATTTISSLDAGMDSGTIHESPLRSHEAPLPEGNTSGSAKDNLNLKELMDIVPKLVLRIDNLEKELQRKKSTYGKAVLTLVVRGRKIQDIDDDPLVSLVKNSMAEKEADFVTPKKNVSTYKRRARSASKGKDIGIGMDFFNAAKERLNSAKVEVNTEVNPSSAGVNTGNTPVSTPSVIHTMNVIVPSLVKSQREGKAPMTSEDVQTTQKTKEQIRQEEACLAEAMRLQALQDEEDARQVHLDALLAKRIQKEQELSEQQQKRKAEVQEAEQLYTEED